MERAVGPPSVTGAGFPPPPLPPLGGFGPRLSPPSVGGAWNPKNQRPGARPKRQKLFYTMPTGLSWENTGPKSFPLFARAFPNCGIPRDGLFGANKKIPFLNCPQSPLFPIWPSPPVSPCPPRRAPAWIVPRKAEKPNGRQPREIETLAKNPAQKTKSQWKTPRARLSGGPGVRACPTFGTPPWPRQTK